MQIQPIQYNPEINAQKNPQFRASSPVWHWVREANGGYSPVATVDLAKKLQRKIISILNGSKKNLSKTEQAIKSYIAKCDIDFRRDKIVRSFYNRNGGWDGNKFEAIPYLLTGKDAIEFDKSFGKAIGLAVKDSPKINGQAISAEVAIAKNDYILNGKTFSQSKKRRLYDQDGIPHSLHTKFQIKRTRTGRIKDYEIIDVKFCPDEGSNNPFVKLGYVKE